ncbi:MAG: DEAD/DEAH box helicase [Planctomycetota bacterium]
MTERPSFDDLGLRDDVLADLAEMGYERPTLIQELAIPPGLAGRDVVGIAQTGTGKTAAFGLPLVERLTPGGGTGALVLSPTRELALQTVEFLEAMGRRRGLRVAVLIGGERYAGQDRSLAADPDVVVGSPGRVLDQIRRRRLLTRGIHALVLDEADRLLDMGFAPQIAAIVRHLPRKRQTMLFSATMPSSIQALARTYMRLPVEVTAGPKLTPVDGCRQEVFVTTPREKIVLLKYLLRQHEGQVLIFTRTRRGADQLHGAIQASGHRVAVLHADREQAERRRALEGYRAGQYRILVATDIAARGLDVEDLAQVVNYDVPPTAEDYIHRVGRTARAKRSGVASTLATIEDLRALRTIETGIGRKIPTTTIPRADLTQFWREEAVRELEATRRNGTPGRRQKIVRFRPHRRS